jgi:D-alanyl-D-alanine dipeptidase
MGFLIRCLTIFLLGVGHMAAVFSQEAAEALPGGFVYLETVDPSILQDMKYATDDNFLGRPVVGYETARCILTQPAAEALSRVQHKIKQLGCVLKVWDAYRPQRAVADFIAWSADAKDQKNKAFYYPNIDKADFFNLGYVAQQSSHSRGSAVDLTVVCDHQEWEMGTRFDFMDPLSHPSSTAVSALAGEHRRVLDALMRSEGFVGYDKEWWHFHLANEPYPERYFDFVVK